MAQPNPQRTSLAILLVLAAMASFALMDGIAKGLTQTLAIPQVLWVRNMVFTLVALGILRLQHPTTPLTSYLHSQRPGLQFARALLLIVESMKTMLSTMSMVFMLAFRLMPIADVHAVAAAAPLLVVALSVVVLKEKVGPRRWAAVLVGFLGVLLIVRPGAGAVAPAMLVALGAAGLWGLYQILVRLASRVDSAATSSLWTAVIGLGATSAVGPFYWVWPDAQSWALLIIVALLGSGAHSMMISALGMTSAATLQPYTYTMFVWAIVFGYLMFGDLPDRWTLAGATIIIASGLYVWYRERVRAAEAADQDERS